MDPLSGHIDGNYSENDKPPRNKRNLNNVPESTSRLQRDVHRDRDARMPPVVHIVSIVDVVDVDVIGPVPHRRPGFRAGINHAEPEASELETRRAFHHYDWNFVDSKPVATAKMRPEAIFRDDVSVVAATWALAGLGCLWKTRFWTPDRSGKAKGEYPPCHSQCIAEPWACGKTRVAPHNRHSKPEPNGNWWHEMRALLSTRGYVQFMGRAVEVHRVQHRPRGGEELDAPVATGVITGRWR